MQYRIACQVLINAATTARKKLRFIDIEGEKIAREDYNAIGEKLREYETIDTRLSIKENYSNLVVGLSKIVDELIYTTFFVAQELL